MDIDFTSDSAESNDSDTCDVNEFSDLFSPCQHIYSEFLERKYILCLSATSETNPYIAAALSDYSCDIFSFNESQVAKITQFKEHTNRLIDCKFSSENSSLLYTGSSDGTIKLWDLRESKGSAVTFTDTTLEESSPIKPLSSFDISPCNRLVAAGTDLTLGDAFILFWDIRNVKLLGAYWESHTDDITQVKFHPNDGNKLMSGSTDGLINLYDLSQPSEDDALQECLNTEALVEQLFWFYEGGKYKINCITSTMDFQLWETDSAEPYKHFRREDISEQTKIKTENVYLVKSHQIRNFLLVLAGSNGNKGKCLRSFQVLNGKTSPAFQFNENSQRVRASWLNENTNLLVTGGEKGIMDIWKPDLSVLNFKTSKKK